MSKNNREQSAICQIETTFHILLPSPLAILAFPSLLFWMPSYLSSFFPRSNLFQVLISVVTRVLNLAWFTFTLLVSLSNIWLVHTLILSVSPTCIRLRISLRHVYEIVIKQPSSWLFLQSFWSLEFAPVVNALFDFVFDSFLLWLRGVFFLRLRLRLCRHRRLRSGFLCPLRVFWGHHNICF